MQLDVIILAAGQGTRMRSDVPKVLHALAGKPLLAHVIDTARQLLPRSIHIVIGHGGDAVRRALDAPDLAWVQQAQQLGTGHAVLAALPQLPDDGTTLVLYGDVPLLQVPTLRTLVERAAAQPALLTTSLADPRGYGRILRDSEGELTGVVEEKDADREQRAINEVNTGVLAAPTRLLARWLPRVGNTNAQGEYYLPDVLPMAVAEGLRVHTLGAAAADVQGVNDRVQLADVERTLQRRLAGQLLIEGVTLADPGRIDIRGSLRCGRDVCIDINAVFEGEVVLGDRVQIGANCVLRNVSIADDSIVYPFTHIADSRIGKSAQLGPFTRLRGGVELGDDCKIGNFVEAKNAQIGVGSKASHLAYLGDCSLGAEVNIGAGTITCNYDGANKHRTVLGDKVFIGSNSTLVAPLAVADNAFVGAGSTITHTVAQGELAVGRARQRNISGWKRPRKHEKP
jgi:bifunctional UDP-N-acetylglucosamine pyrophosphorylase / glucosamine-1-phosphate N-acetyltransferase